MKKEFCNTQVTNLLKNDNHYFVSPLHCSSFVYFAGHLKDSGDDFGAKGHLPSDLNESSLSLINTGSFKGILLYLMCFLKECLISRNDQWTIPKIKS